MGNDCGRPKKEDTPTGGKDPKGKGKPKGGKDGKGNPIINKVGDTPEANSSEKELRRNESDPKEPEPEQQKDLSDLEKKVIKNMSTKRTW